MIETFSLSSETQLFAVFGHPVVHSLSPAFQNAGLQGMGVDGVYLAFDVEPADLPASLLAMSRLHAGGVNLTIPLKETAFKWLDHLAVSASFAGSVNTVVFEEKGTLVGHSTDGVGLIRALDESFGSGFEDKQVLILGCGGAGRAAALQAAKEGASRVCLANRTRSRAEKLEAEIRDRLPRVSVSTCSAWPPPASEMQTADIIIQSTSLGMKEGEVLPVTPAHFVEGQQLLDMIYTQPVTPVMEVAQQAGVDCVNGVGMLLHQGVESLRMWTRGEPPVELMRDALVKAVENRNAPHG